MRVSVESGESSARVKVNGAEVGIARPGAEINETIHAGDVVEIEAFDEPEDHPREAKDSDGGTGAGQSNQSQRQTGDQQEADQGQQD